MAMRMWAGKLRAMVDTEIWSLAKKKPLPERFGTQAEFERAMSLHLKAREFFEREFPRLRVYISLHQLAEIYHVLAFRGYRVPPGEALAVISGILEDPMIVKVPVSAEHVHQAVRESARTGIHVWDFLCFLPVKGFVETIYSADRHFEAIGNRYGVDFVNPVGAWLGP